MTRERTPGHSDPASDSSDRRFAPGEVLAGRHQIIERAGKGRIGEVYHAEDLTLDHPVALKFLPEAISENEERLKRFRHEVRIARQTSHPNVCRVYDIGEVNGLQFLSMEYIEGEDLSSLLRRIGRLPPDKAVEISRQAASGLASAHDEGVLHRDLKPSNVRIDERGQARITDFGLAAAADSIGPDDIRSGTPGFMAQEQWAGKEVTERSDLYSLGLVLYELFSGKRAFDGSSPEERMRLQRDTTPWVIVYGGGVGTLEWVATIAVWSVIWLFTFIRFGWLTIVVGMGLDDVLGQFPADARSLPEVRLRHRSRGRSGARRCRLRVPGVAGRPARVQEFLAAE